MKIALISDLHGNMVALKSVLEDISVNDVDKIICLGDVATLGPEPVSIIEKLQKLNIPCIMGNHDEFLLDDQLIHRYTEAPVIIQSVDWCRNLLNFEMLDYIRCFPRRMRISMGENIELLLFHGSPRSHMEDILATTPADQLNIFLNGETASVMAGGHTHIQMLRQHRGVLIVNPGSVGLPFLEYAEGKQPIIMPYAEYAIIENNSGKISAQFKRLPLDKKTLINRFKYVDFPLAEMLIAQYL